MLFQVDSLKNKYSLLHHTYSLTNGKLKNKSAAEIEEIKKPLSDAEISSKAFEYNKITKYKSEHESNPFFFDTKQPGYLNMKNQIEGEEENNKELILSNKVADINLDDIFDGKIQLTEEEALTVAKNQSSWPMFQDVFMISAKKGHGVEDILEYIVACAYPSKWIFHEKVCKNEFEISKNFGDWYLIFVATIFINQIISDKKIVIIYLFIYLIQTGRFCF